MTEVEVPVEVCMTILMLDAITHANEFTTWLEAEGIPMPKINSVLPHRTSYRFGFDDPDHAILFKLRWL